MEQTPHTQQTLNNLRSEVENSSIISIVAPLFDAVGSQERFHPTRVSEQPDSTQILWKVGERRSNNFEQICLTLSKVSLSLTIALNHRHIESVGEVPSRSTLVVDSRSHTLYEAHHFNEVLLGIYRDREAISRFTPELAHAMAALGL